MANECNIDDILCQFEALNHLKGLRVAVGEENFKSNYPELEGLGDKIVLKITQQNSSIKEALEKCGLPSIQELAIGEEPPEGKGEGGGQIEL